jgi:multidrug efflux pump
MSIFFINRPIFAWVLAILIMLVGALAIRSLPIAQYPSIAPPAVSISVTYPGASADTVQSTVVQVIEQQLSGIDNLLYFSSESDKDGSMTITLNFEQGTDSDTAQVQVQNKLTLATPLLPQEVQQQGIRVAKSTKNFLLVVGLVSRDGRMSPGDISDYIASTLQDPLSRTKGVGDFQLFGSQYAMRIWMDPKKLDNYGLTPVDVSSVIQAQDVQIAAGELGGLPSVKGQQLNATIIGPSRLQKPGEFEKILLKVNADGSQVRLADVARVELNSEDFSAMSLYNGQPAAGIAIKLANGANALATAKAVKATIERLRPDFPSGVEAVYPYDTTPFVTTSITDVVYTLFEAIGLVFLVMLLFLQNFRATLIPTIAVPVVLLGTLGILSLFHYSINTLTMFGMVLSIGLLVDDAIVVVENVERVMAEEGLSPKEATTKSMEQITGALVGIAVVLTAVFLPMSFFGGSTGVIYRQFSVTMISAMVLSVLVALTFTPALCATVLKPRKEQKTTGFSGWFNRWFSTGTDKYKDGLNRIVKRTGLWMIFFLIIALAMAFLFTRMPSGFLPDEDQGVMFVQVTEPPGATNERTLNTLAKIRDYFLNTEKASVLSVFTVSGFSFGGRGQTSGLAFVTLKPWSERSGSEHRVQTIAKRAQGFFQAQIHDAQAFAFAPPAVLELGNATGFDFELIDQANQGHAALLDARNQLLGQAAKDPALFQVRPNGLDDEPQYKFVIDWEKASALGLSIPDITTTLSAAWGSQYVNDFIDRGRVKRVFIQGEANARMLPQDLASWYVRNSSGNMVAFSEFSRASWDTGSPKLERYNGSPAIEILGSPVTGKSTGTALDAMERLAAKLPKGFGFEWTGLSFEERLSGSQAPALYLLSAIFVFLSLAALYESWAIPVSVMLVIPLGILGAVSATLLRGLDNDVFFQVGLLTTVGLSAKNAILIVEFALENHKKGTPLIEATVHAAQERLRPILMTSLAFILGVTPLALSSGAGAGGENAIGTGVIGGMLSATILAVFFVPIFFVVIRSRTKAGQDQANPPPENVTQPSDPAVPAHD